MQSNNNISTGLPSLDSMLGRINHTIRYQHHHLYFSQELEFDQAQFYFSTLPDLHQANVNDDTFFQPSHKGGIQSSQAQDSMRIAWRYQKLPDQDTLSSSKSSSSSQHHFDLSKTMDAKKRLIDSGLNYDSFNPSVTSSYQCNLKSLLDKVKSFLTRTSKLSRRKVKRIVINLNLPATWGPFKNIHQADRLLLSFICQLRLVALACDSSTGGSSTVVWLFTPKLPSGLASRVQNYADYAFQLQGFDAESNNSAFASDRFNGLLTVVRLPQLAVNPGDLVARPATLEWAFKVNRRQVQFQSDAAELAAYELSSSTSGSHLGTMSSTADPHQFQDQQQQHETAYAPTTNGACLLVTNQQVSGVATAQGNGDSLTDIAFDAVEDLLWCVTKAYTINTNSSHLTTIQYNAHSDKRMTQLECLAATNANGSSPGTRFANHSAKSISGDVARYFLGGLQPTLLELDACDKWGQIIREIDVGSGGAVVLRPFGFGLCAGTTEGKVIVLDSRTKAGKIRQLDAHSIEISDMAVTGHTLVTCGWSRHRDMGLVHDRMLRLYDLRSGQSQLPITIRQPLNPSFVRFLPRHHQGQSQNHQLLLVASQLGVYQLIESTPGSSSSPFELGHLWIDDQFGDHLATVDLSSSGNFIAFGTELGNLHLYSTSRTTSRHDLDQFTNHNPPIPTEFASPLAESLWPCNTSSSASTGQHLTSLCQSAVNSVRLLHSSADLGSQQLEAEAVREVQALAFKPIEYDDLRFAVSSLPFPSPVVTGSLATTGPSNDKVDEQRFCKDQELDFDDAWTGIDERRHFAARPMLPIDPSLLASANSKGVARRPAHWGNGNSSSAVWHPYAASDRCYGGDGGGGSIATGNHQPDNDDDGDLEFGRFVSVVQQ